MMLLLQERIRKDFKMKQKDTHSQLFLRQEDKLKQELERLKHKEAVVAEAEGEVERFNQLLAEYQKAPDVTRDRLYLDALQSVLSNSTKVMVDVEGGNNLFICPLDKIMEENKKKGDDDE